MKRSEKVKRRWGGGSPQRRFVKRDADEVRSTVWKKVD